MDTWAVGKAVVVVHTWCCCGRASYRPGMTSRPPGVSQRDDSTRTLGRVSTLPPSQSWLSAKARSDGSFCRASREATVAFDGEWRRRPSVPCGGGGWRVAALGCAHAALGGCAVRMRVDVGCDGRWRASSRLHVVVLEHQHDRASEQRLVREDGVRRCEQEAAGLGDGELVGPPLGRRGARLRPSCRCLRRRPAALLCHEVGAEGVPVCALVDLHAHRSPARVPPPAPTRRRRERSPQRRGRRRSEDQKQPQHAGEFEPRAARSRAQHG